MEPVEDQPLLHQITEEEAVKQPTLSDQLRERRAEIADAKEVLLPVTGYEEFGLMAKHRLMVRPEVEKLGRKVLNETRDRGERNMRILLDTIINSTVGFYLRPSEADKPEEIVDDRLGNAPVINWGSLADYLGWQPSGEGDARSALYWVFGDNEFAVGQYGIVLNRWMGNTGIKVDEEFLGEML